MVGAVVVIEGGGDVIDVGAMVVDVLVLDGSAEETFVDGCTAATGARPPELPRVMSATLTSTIAPAVPSAAACTR